MEIVSSTRQPLIGFKVCRMHRAYQTKSPGRSSPSQQNKVIMQREYREKEGECFVTLRDLIRRLTGEELRTRYEILKKAIDILSAAPEIRGQNDGQGNASIQYEPLPMTGLEGTTLAHVGYFTQPPHVPQSWQSEVEFQSVYHDYGSLVQDGHHHLMPYMDPTFDLSSYPGYSGDFSGYPQP